jgi:hypothetical protein
MGSHSALSLSRGDPSREMRFTQEPQAAQPLPVPRAGRLEVPVDELGFCCLQTPAQIARITHLRREIQLPEAVISDPCFGAREKKETNRDSSVRLRFAGHSSERSASFR